MGSRPGTISLATMPTIRPVNITSRTEDIPAVVPIRPPPFARQAFREQEITDLSFEAREFVRQRFQQTRGRRIFAPPSREGTIVFPGFHGGANWSGASFDPATGRLYVNANEIPWILTMREAPAGYHHRFVSTGYNRFLDPEGFPAVKPIPTGSVAISRRDEKPADAR